MKPTRQHNAPYSSMVPTVQQVALCFEKPQCDPKIKIKNGLASFIN